MSAVFSGCKNHCAKITFIITKSNSKSWLVTYIVLYPQKEMFKTQFESQNENREKRKSINDYIASLCKKTFLSIANDPAHRLHNMLQSSGPSCYNLRCKRRFAIPKCKTERFKNSFLVRSCIDNEFYRSVSFVGEIDDVVYILIVLSFVIFLGLYHYHFIILTIVRFCYIVLYYNSA